MTFTPEQIKELEAPLFRGKVKQREQSGRKLSYIEGWHAIAEANRIFGFDAWSRETIELRCVSERSRTVGSTKAEGWGVSYIARVKVTVGGVIREGAGTGHGIDRDLGQAHESALKEAETDAMKRALMTFGNPFGLALYDKDQSSVSNKPPPAPRTEPTEAEQRAIDRDGMRDMAHETPEPEEPTEEPEPHAISSSGKTPTEWGTELIAHYKASTDLGTLMGWRTANEKVIDQLGPKAIESLAKAYKARYDAIIATMEPAEPVLP